MLTRIDLAVEGPESGAVDAPAVAWLVGAPDASAAEDLTGRLADVLREHGRVVADVSGLDTSHDTADEAIARALPAAMEAAGGWPEVRLTLAGPRPALAAQLVTSRADQRVLVCPDLATAGRHLDQRPPLVHAFWEFTVTPNAPGAARRYVRRVCSVWEVDEEVREAAEIVVTELVTNAVEHATSASMVEVERSATAFRLTVRDWNTAALPTVTLPPTTAPRGRGLAMVAAVASDWGVLTHDDGKTVWAELAAG